APAVRPPAFDPMRATPRRLPIDLEPALRRMRREVCRAIRHDQPLALFQRRKRPRKLRRSGTLMMPERLAVGRNHERGAGRKLESDTRNRLGEMRSVGKEIAERNLSREFAVEAKA